MKGGKDMTRTYTMSLKNNEYTIANHENDDNLIINKKTLVLDGKELYNYIFKSFETGDTICLVADASINDSDDVLDRAVYDNVKEIISKIEKGINELETID